MILFLEGPRSTPRSSSASECSESDLYSCTSIGPATSAGIPSPSTNSSSDSLSSSRGRIARSMLEAEEEDAGSDGFG